MSYLLGGVAVALMLYFALKEVAFRRFDDEDLEIIDIRNEIKNRGVRNHSGLIEDEENK